MCRAVSEYLSSHANRLEAGLNIVIQKILKLSQENLRTEARFV